MIEPPLAAAGRGTRPVAMRRGSAAARAWAGWLILVALVAAPLAIGSVHKPAYIPLLVLTSLAGLASLGGDPAGWRAAVRRLPGAVPIAAFTGLILFQLLPMPPRLLALLSPGTFAYYDARSLLAMRAWHPISMDPAGTGVGLAFWVAFALLYAAAQREGAWHEWRWRVMLAVAGTGALITVVALIQAASPHPTTIYGLWKPVWDWAVFGPYINRANCSNYLAMATCLAVGLLVEALSDLAASWRRRSRGWLALGDREGTRALWLGCVTLVPFVGLLATHARGGLVALICGLAAFTLLLRRRTVGVLGLALVAMAALYFVELGPTWQGFQVRGWSHRFEFWAGVLKTAPHFPLFGSGFNAYARVADEYHVVWPVFNEYLQVLADTGLAGGALVGVLLFRLGREAIATARRSPAGAGLVAALAASAVHAVTDFNWQIEANAATFVALAGLTMSGLTDERNHRGQDRGAAQGQRASFP